MNCATNIFTQTEKTTPELFWAKCQSSVRTLLLTTLLISGTMIYTTSAVHAFTSNQIEGQDNHIINAQPSASTGTLLVNFEPNTSQTERNAIIARMSGRLVRWYPEINSAEVEIIANDNTQILGYSATLEPSVSYIESNVTVYGVSDGSTDERVDGSAEELAEFEVNDPDFDDPTKSYAPDKIGLTAGWNYTTGSEEVVIAILDTGLNLEHPEFAGRIITGYDFVNSDDDPSDDHGHGTHAAGIIAAAVNNGQGTVGICPSCKIMPVKVLNENNAGTWALVASGIRYAVNSGANIINLSLGAQASNKTIEEAIDYAVSQGVFVIAATGNAASSSNFYPAALENVFAVSATDQHDNLWSLSNYGDYVDVAAPGHIIYSTYHQMNNHYNGYIFMSGTSMAAPHVAGLAGLLLAQDPTRSVDELASLIRENADDLGDEGRDDSYGYGRINVHATLAADSGVVISGMPETETDLTPEEEEPNADGPNAEEQEDDNYSLYLPVVQS
ncbi:MAG: S8 family peptidase [Chloroflexota bacterium]